ncbi:MAG: ATP-NAD kinase family protein [Alphaproteobacteria bacterium]|nr:ATP-NAD kinase family protein [Alphaproteobacteria bacterium]
MSRKRAKRIGFLINPIAGMGGTVGLKGTDDVVVEARSLGATPSAHCRAEAMLAALRPLLENHATSAADIDWLTCSAAMGADILKKAGFDRASSVYESPGTTSRDDTKTAIRKLMQAGVDLILFCGGDGTALDVASVVELRLPILGIPAGVKMYSGVFGITPERTADILLGYLEGRLDTAEVDILDLDEERYRQGEWVVRLYATALTPFEPTLVQAAKILITSEGDADVKAEIAEGLQEEIEAHPDILYLLGPGSTLRTLSNQLRIESTLLGVDAVRAGRLVGRDLNERQILDLFAQHPDRVLIVSPIGAQGFVLGRGNRQVSPEVVRKIGVENIIVASTPAKLARTQVLHVDTGDADLDAAIIGSGYLRVVTGFRRKRLIKIES